MEENPYLAQIAKDTGLAVDTSPSDTSKYSDNPYLQQVQSESIKPLEITTSPIKYMSGLDQAAGTINVTNRYPDALANYAKYDVGMSPFGEDWNEIRARNQGVGEKIGRGLLKMGATMSGAIAENTIGVFSGLASMATGGTYADNAVGRSVDEMNEWMAENLPHYYSQKEQDPDRSMLAALGTANFWTDKFANGLGYSLGSLATVWATGGTGLLGRGIGLVGKGIATFGEAAAVGKLATTGDKLKKIYEASKMIKTGAKLSDDVAKTAKVARGLNAAKHLEVGAMMSLAESSVEAREKSKEFIREQFESWEENNPGKSAQQDMSIEERQAILDSARAVENSTFALNMGILIPSNLFTFGSMIGGSKKLAGIPVGESLTDDIMKEGEKYVLKTPNTSFGKTLQKVNKFTSPIYKNSLNEAFQEGAQYAIGVGAGEYFKNKFDTGSGDFSQAINKGLSETFGSADGMESMLLGALIGGGMGAVSTTVGAESSKRKNLAANTERLLNIKNSATFTDIAGAAERDSESLRTIAAITAANQVGNYKLANELRKQLIVQRADKLQKLDAEDLALEEFDDLEKMPEEEFMKRTGYDTTKTPEGGLKATFSEQSGGKSHVQVVQELKDEYKKASKLSRDLDNIIQQVNPMRTGLPGLLQGKERKQADATHRLYNQRLKTILMQHMVSIDTRDEEINKSIDELRRLSPEGPDSFSNINKDDLLTLVKKNKITVSPSGEIQFPKSVVNIALSDTASEEAKAKAKAEEQSPEGQRKKKEEDEDNKILSRIEKAIRYADTLNPIDKIKFNNEIQNLFSGLGMREESIAAFEELITSPEKRDLEILARQGAKTEAKIANDNKEASVIIDEARSTLDLEHLINNDSLSPELREKLLKKYQELKEVEDAYAENFNILTDEHLRDLMLGIEEIKEADPQKAAAVLRVVANRAGETSAEKEARVNAPLTEAQKKAKEEAEASLSAMGGDPKNTPNAKQYVNKIRVTTSDNRNLIVNGIPYRNDKINVLDAIEWDNRSINDQTISPVVSVTLTNKEGQIVIFTAEQDATLAQELAEIITIGYVSEGTADTVEMSKEEAEDKAKNIIAVSKKGEVALENNIKISPEAPPAIYDYAIKEVQKFLDGLFLAKKILEDAYKRNKLTEANLNALESYQTLVQMLEKYTKTLEELQKVRRGMVGTPAQGDPQAEAPEVNQQDSVDIDSERGALIKKRDVLSSTITNLSKQITDLSSKIEDELPEGYRYVEDGEVLPAGDYDFRMPLNGTRQITNAPGGTPEEQQSIENIRVSVNDSLQKQVVKLQADLDLLLTEVELIQNQIDKLTDEHESRKSGETGKTVQDAEEPTGSATEQGDRPEAEGDVEIPEAEELDLNAEEDLDEEEAFLNSLAGSDFGEDEEPTSDTTIQVDYQAEEEEEDEEGYIDEDNFRPEPAKETVIESEATISENAGEIDARLVKNEYRTTDNYDHVVVSSNGTPLTNEDYYGNDIPEGQPGAKSGRKQIDGNGDLIKIFPEVLSSNIESEKETEVIFEVRTDTKFWRENKDRIAATDHWKSVPIFVGVKMPNGKYKRVGLLESFNPDKAESNQSRKDIYDNFLKGKKKITSTIAGKRYNTQNIANAITTDGETFFYNPFKDGAVPTLLIATTEKESGINKFQVALLGDNIKPGDSIPDILAKKTELGKVAMLVKTPSGGFQHLFLTTRKITQAGVDAAKLALINNQSSLLQDLIGFNKVAEFAVNLQRTDMIFSDQLERTNPDTGEASTLNVYTFYHPKAESYIRISAGNLAKAIAKKPFKFSFVKAEVGEKGGVDFNKDVTKAKMQKLEGMESGVVPAFEQAILQRRHQVSAGRLQSTGQFKSPYMDPQTGERKVYNNYIEYLSDPNVIPDVESEGESHTGILASDMFLNQDGSPYFDIGITYGPLLIDGKPLYDNTSSASPKAAKASISPKEEEESDEYSDDNDDTNQTDDDLFNAALGETVEEEPAQDETTASNTLFEDLMESRGIKKEKKEEGEIEFEDETAKMDEEDRGLNDPLINKLIDIRDKEFEGMFEDPVTKEETHYLIKPKGDSKSRKFSRISSFASEPFKGTKEKQVASSKAGKNVHSIVESILMGKTDYTRGEKMSRVAFLELINQIGEIKKLIKKNKETVIATEMIVYRGKNDRYDGQEFAGRFDILVRKPNKIGRSAEYHIYDIKTGSEASLNSYDTGYTDPKTKVISKSKRDQHGTQLSLYAYSLVGLGNLKPADVTGSVLFIPIRYNTEGYIEKVSNMAEKKFTLNYNIKELLKGSVSFEQKKTPSSSDPSIANAGESKGSTKATTKSEAPKGKETEPVEEEKQSLKGMQVDVKGKTATILDAGIKVAILNDAIDADGVVRSFEGQGKTITLEEAQELIDKVIKENC
jgi:hypothetical protein